VSAVFQEDRLCLHLNAVQNVQLVLPDGAARADEIERDFTRLGMTGENLRLPAARLSGGQKRRCALLRALWSPSDTLLLDEPFTGMDPATMQCAVALLKERAAARAVLLASHDRDAIRALGWRVVEQGGEPYAL
jgi:NitT/TauT family transport system ATP-binding protein